MKTTPVFFLLALVSSALAQSLPLEKPKNHGGFPQYALSPDGTLVAGGTGVITMTFNGRKQASDGGEVILWDAKTGKIRRTLGKHDATPEWLAWSADGGLLASGSCDDGVVKVWDTRSGTLKATLKAGGKLAKSGNGSEVLCAFSADGRAVATVVEKKSKVGDNDVRVGDTLALWDVAAARTRWQVQDSQVATLALSPDAKTLAAYSVKVIWKADAGGGASGAHSEPRLVAWDVAGGKELWRVDAGRLSPETLTFVPGTGLLAVDGRDFTPIDSTTGKPGATAKGKGMGTVRAVTFSADGRRYVASDFMGNEITWGDTTTGAATAVQKLEKRMSELAFSRDLKMAVGVLGFDPAIVTLSPTPAPPR